MQNKMLSALVLSTGLLAFSGCTGGDAGEGTVAVNTYGEAFIEEGIPAEEVTDGWAVTFDRFEVTLSGITIGDQTLEGPYKVDVSGATDGAGHSVGELTLPAGEYSGQDFEIERVELSGVASKDGVEKNFAWTFDAPVHYMDCEANTVVEDGGNASFQITIHADHYLYDSLVSEDPSLVFQGIADADADDDGTITKEELEAAGIGALDPGNEEVTNMWQWLVAQNATLGHVDGEGHCDAHTHGN